MPEKEKKKVLITGAAGKIGTALRKHLRDCYQFRLLLRSTIPHDICEDDEIVKADTGDLDAMVRAAKNVDAIVHLALRRWPGISKEDVARITFNVDMRGTYNIFEAARINGVSTVVFASTNHVTGMYEKEGILSHPDLPIRPDSIYGVGKAFGEALGRLYAEHYKMHVFCLRIGNFNGEKEPGKYYKPGYSRWHSPRDLANMVMRSIEKEDVRFGIFYGVSRGADKVWDLSNAKELLGYEPKDDGSLPQFRAKHRKSHWVKMGKNKLGSLKQRFSSKLDS